MMTPQEQHRRNIEELLIQCKRDLNQAADVGQINEVSRLSDQLTSLSKLLEAAS